MQFRDDDSEAESESQPPIPGKGDNEKYSEQDEMLLLATGMGSLPKPELNPERKALQRAQLIAAMERALKEFPKLDDVPKRRSGLTRAFYRFLGSRPRRAEPGRLVDIFRPAPSYNLEKVKAVRTAIAEAIAEIEPADERDHDEFPNDLFDVPSIPLGPQADAAAETVKDGFVGLFLLLGPPPDGAEDDGTWGGDTPPDESEPEDPKWFGLPIQSSRGGVR